MYYKIKNDILYRQYKGYGYITDNSLFGYRSPHDNRRYPGEKYVSESGAIMLAALSKIPQSADEIVENLLSIFTDVDRTVLRQDMEEFFQSLVTDGFLCQGETLDSCRETDARETEMSADKVYPTVATENWNAVLTQNCDKELFIPQNQLRSLHIELCRSCNERCIHCYIPQKNKASVIAPDLFYRILEEGRAMNIIHVTLSGGEPLLHKEFSSFLHKCRQLDLSVNVLSNLTLLTDDHIAQMTGDPLLSVQTSLYSMNPCVHDKITRLPGSFERTRDAILRLHTAGIPLQISCPIMRHNKDSYHDVIIWAEALDIGVVVEPVIFGSCDGSRANLTNRLSLEEVGKTVEQLLADVGGEPLRKMAQDKETQTGNHPICTICRYNFCVSASGSAFPCVGWERNSIGDLNRQSIREIWETSQKIKELRGITRSQFPRCVNCEDRGYCTVCMMRNANENPDGDPFRINPFQCETAAMTRRKTEIYLR